MRIALFTVLLVGASPAQDTWRIVDGSGHPPGTHLTFDRARGELLLDSSGGETWTHDGERWDRRAVDTTANLGPRLLADDTGRRRVVQQNMQTGQTREWDGFAWTLRTTNPSLISDRATMAFDPIRQRTVLSHWVTSSSSYHTWEWDGTAWTRLDTTFWATPDAMTFDERRGRVVGLIFGTNLYEWTGATWQLVRNALLPARTAGDWSMAYDTRRQRLVFVQCNAPQLEVFEWDGTTVTNPTPPAAPPGRRTLRTVWEPLRERVVCRGGEAYPNWWNDTWEWDGAIWTERDATPTAGRPLTMAYDATRDRTVLYGTVWMTLQPSTWEFDGHRWHHLPAAASLPPTIVGRFVHDPVRARLQFIAPNGPTLQSWTFDGATFTPLATGNTPPARDGFALVFDSNRQEVLMFGGATGLPIAETWRFDGTAWTQAFPASSPTPRRDHAMAFDPLLDRTILFGGGPGDTWEWNGATWTRRFPATVVAARFGHTMTFDPQRGAVVLTGGGYVTGPPLSTWARPAELFEWTGSDWRRRVTSGLPAQIHGQIVHDGRGLLLHGGQRERRPNVANDLVLASTTWRLANAPAAAAAAHGAGCAGALGVPHFAALHVPYLGNPAFGVRVTSVPVGTPVVVAWGDAVASIPLGGACTQLAAPLFAGDFAIAGSGGAARVALPVPDGVALLGYQIVAQAAAIDGVGAWNGTAVSGALRLTIGR